MLHTHCRSHEVVLNLKREPHGMKTTSVSCFENVFVFLFVNSVILYPSKYVIMKDKCFPGIVEGVRELMFNKSYSV